MEYEISTDAARLDLEVIHGFLRGAYWSPGIRREVVERAVAGSLVVGAYVLRGGQEGSTARERRWEQVGFARAVTDYATFGDVCDVFVVEAHRGKGLARGMVKALMDEPRVQTLRRWALVTRDAQKVYAGLGFVEVKPGRWMERVMEEWRWKE